MRAEARHQAHEAEAVRDQVGAELEVVRQTAAAAQVELEATRAQLAEIRGTLGAEREAHAATEARLQEIRRQLDETGDQLTQVRTEFAVALDRARERVTAAEERAASHEKRALREIDQERTAHQKCEKQVEEPRTQLQTVRVELKDAAVQHAEALASLRTELRLSQQQTENVAQQHLATLDELTHTRSQLRDAQRRAERADAEVQVTRRLIDDMKKAPAGRPAPRQKPVGSA